MIDNKNNWYLEAKSSSQIIQEAGMGDTLKMSILAVGLLLSGVSLLDAAEQTGLSPEQIYQAKNNPEIVERAKIENSVNIADPIIDLDNQDEKLPKHGLQTGLNMEEIKNLIRLHEVSGGTRYVTVNGKKVDIRKVYPDPIYGWKVPTIGVGYNLNRSKARGEIEALGLSYSLVRKGEQFLTDEQVDILYDSDIENAIKDAKSFLPNFDEQPSDVKTVLVDMSFNLGLTKLSTFKKFRESLLNFNFIPAAYHMRDSNWAKQTKSRADTLINKMRNVYEPKTPKTEKPQILTN